MEKRRGRREPQRNAERESAALCALCVLCVSTLVGCSREKTSERPSEIVEPRPSSQRAFQFTDKTEQSGIDFTYRNGSEAEHFAILETVGGGVGLLDYDGDGDLDVFLPGGGRFENRSLQGLPSAVFRNHGNWRFEPVGHLARCEAARFYSHGVAADDVDHDGFPDFIVTGYGGISFFRNQGDGTFRESASELNLLDPSWSTSAAWGDIDANGHPDLYLVHYVDWSFDNHPQCFAPRSAASEYCSPLRFEGLADRLLLNSGDGRFVANEPGALDPGGKGLGVVMGDVDSDGDLDVYVANDTTANFLYLNDGTGRLEESGLISATAFDDYASADGSMGVDLGDFNHDGQIDIWVANFENESFALYQNVGNALFNHVSRTVGITDVGGLYVGWGTGFADFDGDGDEDLVAANGHVMHRPLNAPVRQQPLLFENEGGIFRNIAAEAGSYMATSHPARGLALGDLDNDGGLDLVISHQNEPVRVLANETQRQDWIGFRLIGTASPRRPTGAVVRVWTAKGDQLRQLCGGRSYLSSHDPRLYFGLADQPPIRAEVRWPSGAVQMLEQLEAGRVHLVIEDL